MQGEDFGGPTQRSQESEGMFLQGSNRSNSSMGFRVASTTIHRPTQGVDSRGATSLLCLALFAIMFIELCFNFMSLFTYLYLM
jgi:hypothetical protein